jgi:hypothetical protein
MDTKLTIKLDKTVIEKAKDYAYSHNKSLSRLIETYLKSLLMNDDKNDNEEIQISPFIKSMSTGKSIPPDINYQKEYSDYLIQKHK